MRNDPDITATKVYFPQEGQIQVHRQRVARCPPELVAGYYWYGAKQQSRGKVPQWVENLIKASTDAEIIDSDKVDDKDAEHTEELETLQDGGQQMSSLLVAQPDSMVQGQQEEADGSLVPEDNTVDWEAAKQWNLPDKSPYSLRRKIITPKRYQQARDEL